jgi:exodeoxyribonuclease V gamma subunit
VGELLDAIDATVRRENGPARDRVVIHHPLQPFDPRNFIAGDIVGPHPWSFDPTALAGARALTAPRALPRPFVSAPLPPRPGPIVELADLVRFVEHPVRAFLRQRLGISLYSAADEVEDELSVELDGLQRWGVGQRLLDARLRGIDGRTAVLAEIARGTLPPGVLGKPVIEALTPIVAGIVERANAVAAGSAGAAAGGEPVDVRVALDDGRLLSGTVTGVRGDLLLSTTFSRVSAKHRIAAWVRLLALSATWPERPFAAATVGRGQGRDDVRTAWVHPLGPEGAARAAAAHAELAVVMDLYDRGMREPLPMFCQSSAAYADAAHRGQDGLAAAAKEWESEWNFEKEDRDAEHQMAFGGVLTLSEMIEMPPADGEGGDGWPESETSRFGRLSRRLWEGLLDREEVRAR